MTKASAETFTMPTPALIDGAASHGAPADTKNPLDATYNAPLDAYSLANEADPAGKAFLALIQAHHAMGRRNTAKLAVSMQALAAADTPTEFSTLQSNLLTEAMTAAVSDGETIAKLTAAAFSTAFKPLQMKVGDLRKGEARQE